MMGTTATSSPLSTEAGGLAGRGASFFSCSLIGQCRLSVELSLEPSGKGAEVMNSVEICPVFRF